METNDALKVLKDVLSGSAKTEARTEQPKPPDVDNNAWNQHTHNFVMLSMLLVFGGMVRMGAYWNSQTRKAEARLAELKARKGAKA